MEITLLVDIGSTYTKVTAADLAEDELIGTSYSPSTVDTDMTIGVKRAYEQLLTQSGIKESEVKQKLACSSAAGGLRVAVSGLVTSLTTEAAKRAAYGVGAKIIGVYSYQLTPDEVKTLEQTSPDVMLLAGGTDGGNKDVLRHNARAIADSSLHCPVIVAGNKEINPEARGLLEKSGKFAVVAENVMPEINKLNIEPVRKAIRDIFIQRIIHGKGLDKAKEFVGGVIMPTPLAVLNGARLLADGTDEERGIGPLMVVDVGGATVDVDSISDGRPTQPGVTWRGLPEPYDKRTVEGDLGIRYNSLHILETAGEQQLLSNLTAEEKGILQNTNFKEKIEGLSAHINVIPRTEEDFLVDTALACAAVDIATERHAGNVESIYLPSGPTYIQTGKDLTNVETVIGTGGIFTYGRGQKTILNMAKFTEKNSFSLRPKDARFFIDEKYILYAVGLLSTISPESGLRIMKKNLSELS
jgi:uncharacterized protein (TIGR01319 family)